MLGVPDDRAHALLLRGDGHRIAHSDARAQQPVRRQQLMSFCEAHTANFATSSVTALQHLQPHQIVSQRSGPELAM